MIYKKTKFYKNKISKRMIRTGKCLVTLTGHNSSIRCLLILSNDLLASGSEDRTIKIWYGTLNLHKTFFLKIKKVFTHSRPYQSIHMNLDDEIFLFRAKITIKINRD